MQNKGFNTIPVATIHLLRLCLAGLLNWVFAVRENCQTRALRITNNAYLASAHQTFYFASPVSFQAGQRVPGAFLYEGTGYCREKSVGIIPENFNLTQDVLVVKLTF